MLARTRRRRGAVSLITLFAVPVLLLVVGLVVYVASLRDAKGENQTGADAAALAAARSLACDEMLLAAPAPATRFGRARTAAVGLAEANYAAGEQLTLRRNDDNSPAGDLVLGHVDPLAGVAFAPASGDPGTWAGQAVNAVRVTVRRSSVRGFFGGASTDEPVVARATAILDFRAIGFRPMDGDPAPVVPIALYTDHTRESRHAWDAQCRRRDRDEWWCHPETGKFTHDQKDGIPEVRVVLGKGALGDDGVPAMFVHVGGGGFDQTVAQIRSGLPRVDLPEEFASGLCLRPDNVIKLPGTGTCPSTGESRQALDDALRAVRDGGRPVAWPLVSKADDDGERVHVTGWTAARLVAFETSGAGGVVLTLQPAVLCHPSVVVEGRDVRPAFWTNNLTVCRVRLAD